MTIRVLKQTMIDQLRAVAEEKDLPHVYLEIDDGQLIWAKCCCAMHNNVFLGQHSFPYVNHLPTDEMKLAAIIDWLHNAPEAPDITLVDWI